MKEDKFEKAVFKDALLFTGWALVIFMAGVVFMMKDEIQPHIHDAVLVDHTHIGIFGKVKR